VAALVVAVPSSCCEADVVENFAARRELMVRRDIEARGIADARVLAAMGRVPREQFIPARWQDQAYDDGALPIAAHQTISQPYVVAWMVDALELPSDARVLEIGTGSGYGAAVLAEIATEVVTVERHAELADHARAILQQLDYRNVIVVVGDGTLGHQERAPYDGISVTAAAPEVPPALLDQLTVGGRLVMPIGDREGQELTVVTRAGDQFSRKVVGGVRFVPLIGEQGW
jgi:protein-L-isoaspartate(D-aspartate) O-methyltransferase